MIGYLKNMERDWLLFEIMGHARCLTKLIQKPALFTTVRAVRNYFCKFELLTYLLTYSTVQSPS